MKHPKLRLNKTTKIKEVRKFKQDIKEVVHDCLIDIEPYIVNDILHYLKKRGFIYGKKASKKNTAKKKAKKKN